MKITVTTLTDEIFSFEISQDLELDNFKAFCEVETGIPSNEIVIMYHGRPLTDDRKSLKDLGLKDGDIVILQQHRSTGNTPSTFGLQSNSSSLISLPQFDFGSIQVPPTSEGHVTNGSRTSSSSEPERPSNSTSRNLNDPATIRDILLNDREQLQQIEQSNPALAAALKAGDFETFSRMIRELQVLHEERERQRRLLRRLSAEPFDVEAQRLIAEEIRQKNIDANMEAAIEFNPESFATVLMLYINCKVNGHPVKAFIDSGAQTTIMSTECAERCNIMRLVDVRFSGIAKGVGIQKIIGRIHMVQIQIDKDFLTSSFSILEDQKMDMLFGLDMLKRHQCVIDLRKNVLLIGTTGTETPFLPESDLPDLAKLTSSKTQLSVEDNPTHSGTVEETASNERGRSSTRAGSTTRSKSAKRRKSLPET